MPRKMPLPARQSRCTASSRSTSRRWKQRLRITASRTTASTPRSASFSTDKARAAATRLTSAVGGGGACLFGRHPRMGPRQSFLFDQEFSLPEFPFSFLEGGLRLVHLRVQISHGARQVLAPPPQRFGGHRVIEMLGVGDPVLAFLDRGLLVEFVLFALEIGNHQFDFAHLTA